MIVNDVARNLENPRLHLGFVAQVVDFRMNSDKGFLKQVVGQRFIFHFIKDESAQTIAKLVPQFGRFLFHLVRLFGGIEYLECCRKRLKCPFENTQ